MKNHRHKLLKFTSVKIITAGVTCALGLSACASSTSTKSARQISPAVGDSPTSITLATQEPADRSSDSKSSSISSTNLTGVDSQIIFSTDIGSMWINQRISLAAIAPASIGTSDGKRTFSTPISGGNLTYNSTERKVSGIIHNSGGLQLTQQGRSTLIITDLNINLSSRLITATINGRKDTPLFSVDGTPVVSENENQTTIRGVVIKLWPKVDLQIQNNFSAAKPLGILTVTTSNPT